MKDKMYRPGVDGAKVTGDVSRTAKPGMPTRPGTGTSMTRPVMDTKPKPTRPMLDSRPSRDPRFRKPRSMSKNMSTSATTKMEALRRMKGSK